MLAVTYQLTAVDVDPIPRVGYLGPEELTPIVDDFPVQLPPDDVVVSVE